ncbi:MAG: hypothetical protein WBQ73_02525 [Candidatus Babeliales bacterium]
MYKTSRFLVSIFFFSWMTMLDASYIMKAICCCCKKPRLQEINSNDRDISSFMQETSVNLRYLVMYVQKERQIDKQLKDIASKLNVVNANTLEVLNRTRYYSMQEHERSILINEGPVEVELRNDELISSRGGPMVAILHSENNND